VVLLFSFFLFGLLSPLSDRIQRWATQIRWHPLKLIRSTESVYGNITALAVDGQDVLYLNGVPSIFLPYPDITAVEELVHLPLLAHPDPADVLFVGGGVGGALAEAQKHPLDRLVYAELDPVLIREVEKVRPEESAAELGEPRTRVVYEDGRFYLRGTEERFHVILCHLPDASTLQLNRFFTREFFDLASRHLHPDGVLAFAMPGSSSYLSRELLRLNACVLETLRSAFPHVRVIPGERNLFLASPAGKLEAVSAAVLEERLEQRRIEAAVIGPRYLRYQLDAGREKWLYRELASVTPIRINRDLSPALLYYFISWRNAELQPFLRNPVSWFGKLSVGWLLAILAAIALGVLIRVAVRRGRPRFAVSFSILGSGFAGMAVELVVILAFQSVYGYLYQWIGLLIAVFMAGLAAGSALATWRLDRVQSSYRIFCIIEGVLTSLLLLSAWALPAVQEFFLGRASLAPAPQITFVALNLLAGLLVGSEFPLANRAAAFRTGPGTSEVAGKLYALDLAGAWLGTFLVSLLLVPLLGLGSTLLAAAGLKVLNLACLACRR
jgi:spermidine synthase